MNRWSLSHRELTCDSVSSVKRDWTLSGSAGVVVETGSHNESDRVEVSGVGLCRFARCCKYDAVRMILG